MDVNFKLLRIKIYGFQNVGSMDLRCNFKFVTQVLQIPNLMKCNWMIWHCEQVNFKVKVLGFYGLQIFSMYLTLFVCKILKLQIVSPTFQSFELKHMWLKFKYIVGNKYLFSALLNQRSSGISTKYLMTWTLFCFSMRIPRILWQAFPWKIFLLRLYTMWYLPMNT